ncbi:MAG TPA: hypothetical protein VM925_05630 [Labilithrix sp.]|nr:hypothetical protein [Labilithrix sp.]
MPVKSHIALVMVLASTAACAPSADDGDEMDETEEATTATVATAVALGNDDVVPGPLDYPVPSVSLPQKHRLWELPKTSELLRETEPSGNCAVHFLKFFDPVRGRMIQIPVTICN